MTEANARPGVVESARRLDAAVKALAVARDELRRAGLEDEAETVAAILAELGCDLDTVTALAESRARDLRRLRELWGDGDPDGCSGCGSFSHASGDCPGEG